MSRATNWLEIAILNALFGRAAWPTVTHLYGGLWLSGATAAGLEAASLVSEVDAGGGSNYARITLNSTVVMSDPVNNVGIPNATDLVWNQASTPWGTIGWLGLVNTGGTNGSLYLYASLNAPIHITTGERFEIGASCLVFSCD